jgi:hypothetical protein
VKFEEGFDWRLGGKLPGFGGGDEPGGGRHSLEGFSSRIMWRGKGMMHQYSYYHTIYQENVHHIHIALYKPLATYFSL